MNWEIAITVIHTIQNIVESIKLNQATVEIWILYQAINELIKLYVSMSKSMLTEVVQKYIKEIYLKHGEDDQELSHFFQHLKNACLEILNIVCLHLIPFLRYFFESRKEKAHLYFSIFLDTRYYRMKNVQSFQESCGMDRSFTSAFKSIYIRYLYQLILDFKLCHIVDPP